jgi:lipoprotein-anchoring transpeptidase ErfK/SrfK
VVEWCVAATTPDERRPRLTRRALAALIALLLVAAAAIVATERVLEPEAADAEPSAAAPSTSAAPEAPAAPAANTAGAEPQVPVSTVLASPHGEVPAYDHPNGTLIGAAGKWYGYDMTMPVLQQGFGWVQVMMPERPNGSTAWLRTSDVELSTTAYRIVVRRGSTHVDVYKDGFPLFDFAAGMGKSSTPTPLGSFFVAVVENPGPPGYGSVVLDLSAHSEAIQSWQGAGDAIIAFHGPFGSQSTIRNGGGYISNGCLRMLPEDQIKLAEIPVGTPVDIVE